MTEKTKDVLISIGFIMIAIAAFVLGVFITNTYNNMNATSVHYNVEDEAYVMRYNGKNYYVSDKTGRELIEVFEENGE